MPDLSVAIDVGGSSTKLFINRRRWLSRTVGICHLTLAIGVESANPQEQPPIQKTELGIGNLAAAPIDEPRSTARSISKQIGNVFGDED